jgi:thioredoxin 1
LDEIAHTFFIFSSFGMVKFIENEREWEVTLSSPANPLVIADFTASWCGPCKQISPVFEKLSNEVKGKMHFVKVDVDQQQQLAQRYGVSAMPTFKVFLQGREIRELKGADKAGLERMIHESIQFYKDKLTQHEQNRSKPVTETREELMAMSIKELKLMLTSRSISLNGLVEKVDLINTLLGNKK